MPSISRLAEAARALGPVGLFMVAFSVVSIVALSVMPSIVAFLPIPMPSTIAIPTEPGLIGV